MDSLDVIDLCDSPSPRKERSSPERGGGSPERDNRREKGERWHKRQRLSAPGVPPGRTVVELSDGDDEEQDDSKLARRLQEAESSQLRANHDEDLRLARRLQQEECSGLPPSCSGAFGMPGLDPVGMGLHSAALGVHGGRWDWLGSLARRPGLGGVLAQGQHPFDAAPGHMFAPPRRPAAGGRAAGQFGHLEMLDRDFGEADYEMLLRLDDRRDLQKQARSSEIQRDPARRDATPSPRCSQRGRRPQHPQPTSTPTPLFFPRTRALTRALPSIVAGQAQGALQGARPAAQPAAEQVRVALTLTPTLALTPTPTLTLTLTRTPTQPQP